MRPYCYLWGGNKQSFNRQILSSDSVISSTKRSGKLCNKIKLFLSLKQILKKNTIYELFSTETWIIVVPIFGSLNKSNILFYLTLSKETMSVPDQSV